MYKNIFKKTFDAKKSMNQKCFVQALFIDLLFKNAFINFNQKRKAKKNGSGIQFL